MEPDRWWVRGVQSGRPRLKVHGCPAVGQRPQEWLPVHPRLGCKVALPMAVFTCSLHRLNSYSGELSSDVVVLCCLLCCLCRVMSSVCLWRLCHVVSLSCGVFVCRCLRLTTGLPLVRQVKSIRKMVKAVELMPCACPADVSVVIVCVLAEIARRSFDSFLVWFSGAVASRLIMK